jgi:hypothetical protein
MSTATRSIFFVAVLVVMAGTCVAQIPNPGFENWANGDPVSWSTNNGVYTFVTQATPANGGSSAAQGVVVNVGAFNLSASLNATAFPVSQRYAALHGFYKYTPASGDFLVVSYIAEKGGSGVGQGSFVELSAQSVFREFIADVLYLAPDVPDAGNITISISGAGGFPHIGSVFVVDDLSFGAASGVNDLPNGLPKAFRLEQNYPNPFNPTTNIVYDIPQQTHVSLAVLNVLGQEVMVLVDQVQSAGRYKAVVDASALPSGVYFYRLVAGNFTQTHKMTLVR